MPAAEVIAVPARGRVVRGHAEVAEVPPGGRVDLILVVAWDGARALLELPPTRGIAPTVVAQRAVGIGIVAEVEHGARNGIDDRGGLPRVLKAAFPNVTGPDKDLWGPGGLDDHRERVGVCRAVRHPTAVHYRLWSVMM